MGFYGNITNTSNTTFSFDRIYPNKQSMDANVNNDGIFIGRYVLIEYDQDAAYPVVYKKPNENRFYSSKNFEQATEIKLLTGEQADEYKPTEDDRVISGKQYYKKENNKYIAVSLNSNDIPSDLGLYEYVSTADGVYEGEIVQVQTIQTDNNGNLITILIDFYECVGGSDGIAQFDQIGEEPNAGKSNYIKNFAIDEKHLNGEQQKSFKGYDSTVWMKSSVTASDGKLISKYVNIADLNSVVPTFDIAADAPTMTPITPHFDADSTNVYYKLHAQPQWGFRIAKAHADGDTADYISDADTQWTKIDYNPSTDETDTLYASGIDENKVPIWNGGPNTTIPAAIFYNARAFEKQIGETSIDKYSKDITEDKIEITIGKSGNEYNLHNGKQGPDKGVQDDTQELTIHLPSIGNMMSDAWDIIHGKQRNDYRGDGENSSLQGRLDAFQDICANQIAVKSDEDGTFVGSKINNGEKYIHEGDILDKRLNVEDEGLLNNDDPWIRTYINTADLVHSTYQGDSGLSQEDNNGIAIQHTFHATADSETSLDKNNGEAQVSERQEKYIHAIKDSGGNIIKTPINAEMGNKTDEIKLYTPYVDATGHVVGKNIETVTLPYGYKYFKTDGIVSEDEKGDLYSTNVNTNGIQETKPTKVESDTEAHNTQDTLSINPANKWIQTKLVDTENDGDVLTIAHEIHSIDETVSEQGDNKTSHSNLNNIEAVGGDEVNLTMYDWTYDNAGHITSKREHTYTLPYGYKTITTNGRRNFEDINTEAFDSNKNAAEKRSKIVADTTQDSLALNSGNKWIRIDTDANNDEVVFSHDVHEITHDITEEATDDLNNNKNNTIQNKINIPDWTFDNAGHITHKSDRIYTLPYGYKHVVVNNNGSSVIAKPGSTTGTQTADSTQGALTLDSSNKWIVLDKTNSNDIIKFGHLHSELSSGTHELKAQEPKFGKTFNIQTFTTDNAGHLIDKGVETVKIPEGKYEKDTPNTNSASLIVGMKLDGPTGEITTSSATTNTLQLSNYTYIGNGTKDTQTVANGQSINTALGTLEKRINDLDYADPDANTTQFVSKITENEGIISVERANVGGLVLTGYTASGKGSGEVGETDTVNSAFAKIENKINTFLKAADTSTNAIDTLKELQTYIEEHDVEATNIIKSINDEVTRATNAENANTSLINQEISRAQSKENEIVNNLNNEISRATEEEGKLNTRIDNLVGNTKVSTQIDNKINTFNSTLGSAAFTESSAYVDATTYANKIKELEDRIKELEDKLNPESETPVEGE